jgi:hypothetical protein
MPSLLRSAQFRTRTVAFLLLTGWLSTPLTQAQVYAGVLGGVSRLSGDARSVLSPSSTEFSSYDPKNGGAVELLDV